MIVKYIVCTDKCKNHPNCGGKFITRGDVLAEEQRDAETGKIVGRGYLCKWYQEKEPPKQAKLEEYANAKK